MDALFFFIYSRSRPSQPPPPPPIFIPKHVYSSSSSTVWSNKRKIISNPHYLDHHFSTGHFLKTITRTTNLIIPNLTPPHLNRNSTTISSSGCSTDCDFLLNLQELETIVNIKILGFDYGGQQLVSETCLPCGTFSNPSMKDLEYMVELMQLIKSQNIPLLAPIEQQWSDHSKSRMSPASSLVEDEIFSWVDVITNFPTVDAPQRREITEEFFRFKKLTQTHLWDKYSAYEHWANTAVPKDEEELAALQARLRKRFPVDAYNRARNKVNNRGRLCNTLLVEKLFPQSN